MVVLGSGGPRFACFSRELSEAFVFTLQVPALTVEPFCLRHKRGVRVTVFFVIRVHCWLQFVSVQPWVRPWLLPCCRLHETVNKCTVHTLQLTPGDVGWCVKLLSEEVFYCNELRIVWQFIAHMPKHLGCPFDLPWCIGGQFRCR